VGRSDVDIPVCEGRSSVVVGLLERVVMTSMCARAQDKELLGEVALVHACTDISNE
jgi:hypothetical protein